MSEEFRHNPEASRFEAWIDGRRVGSAEYTLRGNVASFHHTNVDAALNGQGVAGRLVTSAMDQVRAAGEWKVEPACAYVSRWMKHHPDYADLLA
ncbi:MAG: GNAT family N-acetyltransferase [Propionicimonas sp.]